MKIEDYNDYQQVTYPCCCLLPDCSNDIYLHQKLKLIFTDGTATGNQKQGDPNTFYLQEIQTCPSNGKQDTYTYNTYYEVFINSTLIPPPRILTVVQNIPGACPVQVIKTYNGPIAVNDTFTELRARFDANIDFNNPYTTFTQAFGTTIPQSQEQGLGVVRIVQNRYQYSYELDNNRPDVKWYKLEWDEYWVHPDYENWAADYMSYLEEKEQHDAWLECEQQTPGNCGTEPFLRPEPKRPETATVEFLNHRTFEYDGQDGQTDYYDVPLRMIGEERNFRIVNFYFHCFRSNKLGSIPALLSDKILEGQPQV